MASNPAPIVTTPPETPPPLNPFFNDFVLYLDPSESLYFHLRDMQNYQTSIEHTKQLPESITQTLDTFSASDLSDSDASDADDERNDDRGSRCSKSRRRRQWARPPLPQTLPPYSPLPFSTPKPQPNSKRTEGVTDERFARSLIRKLKKAAKDIESGKTTPPCDLEIPQWQSQSESDIDYMAAEDSLHNSDVENVLCWMRKLHERNQDWKTNQKTPKNGKS